MEHTASGAIRKKILPVICVIHLLSCTTINVFEKNISFRDHEWSNSSRPSIRFNITDTVSLYNLYVVIRHADAYNYNNIWMNIYTKSPGDSVKVQPLDLLLADNIKGWLGTGMDDIFEHRIRITSAPVQLKRSGEYQFTFEQIMREEPLQHILNVGLRIEKQ